MIDTEQTSQAAFATLWKCLRSVRRYAFRGLIFTRNVDFRVVNKEELSLETGQEGGVDVAQTMPVTPSIWRTRTRTSSNSSLGDSKSGSSSHHASPTTGNNARKPRLVSGLQANQEQVRVPPKTRIEELSNTFYGQLSERLSHLVATTQGSEPAGDISSMDSSSASDEVNALLKMVQSLTSVLRLHGIADILGVYVSMYIAGAGAEGAQAREDRCERRRDSVAAAREEHGVVEPHRHEPRTCVATLHPVFVS